MVAKLVELLREHAERHPEYGQELRECADEIVWASQRKPEDPRERIVAALRDGCSTVSDIRRWTSLSDWKVRNVLLQLVEERLVLKFGPGEVIARERGGQNVEVFILRGGSQ